MALSIRVDGLSFSFGPRGDDCLRGVSLEVGESELCCLLGPNGAGKTTLIRCILGLLKPHAGSMSVAGHDTAALSARQLARLVAYVPQSITAVFPFTTLEMVLMGRTPHLGMTASPSRADRRLCVATLERLGAGHLASRPFSQLSGGERQLTMLARALVQEAPVLVLDEPTAALDYGNEIRILQLITSLVSGRFYRADDHAPAQSSPDVGRQGHPHERGIGRRERRSQRGHHRGPAEPPLQRARTRDQPGAPSGRAGRPGAAVLLPAGSDPAPATSWRGRSVTAHSLAKER